MHEESLSPFANAYEVKDRIKYYIILRIIITVKFTAPAYCIKLISRIILELRSVPSHCKLASKIKQS